MYLKENELYKQLIEVFIAIDNILDPRYPNEHERFVIISLKNYQDAKKRAKVKGITIKSYNDISRALYGDY